jgi:hypothetical protein
MFIIVVTTVVVGLIAIALAEPRARFEVVVWSDDIERRLVHERELHAGGW